MSATTPAELAFEHPLEQPRIRHISCIRIHNISLEDSGAQILSKKEQPSTLDAGGNSSINNSDSGIPASSPTTNTTTYPFPSRARRISTNSVSTLKGVKESPEPAALNGPVGDDSIAEGDEDGTGVKAPGSGKASSSASGGGGGVVSGRRPTLTSIGSGNRPGMARSRSRLAVPRHINTGTNNTGTSSGSPSGSHTQPPRSPMNSTSDPFGGLGYPTSPTVNTRDRSSSISSVRSNHSVVLHGAAELAHRRERAATLTTLASLGTVTAGTGHMGGVEEEAELGKALRDRLHRCFITLSLVDVKPLPSKEKEGEGALASEGMLSSKTILDRRRSTNSSTSKVNGRARTSSVASSISVTPSISTKPPTSSLGRAASSAKSRSASEITPSHGLSRSPSAQSQSTITTSTSRASNLSSRSTSPTSPPSSLNTTSPSRARSSIEPKGRDSPRGTASLRGGAGHSRRISGSFGAAAAAVVAAKPEEKITKSRPPSINIIPRERKTSGGLSIPKGRPGQPVVTLASPTSSTSKSKSSPAPSPTHSQASTPIPPTPPTPPPSSPLDTPFYISSIHQPSTHPTFASLDPRSDFADWLGVEDASGYRLRVEAWLEEEEKEELQGDKGKGKANGKTGWKKLDLLDEILDLRQVKKLTKDTTELPPNTLILSFSTLDKARYYYIPSKKLSDGKSSDATATSQSSAAKHHARGRSAVNAAVERSLRETRMRKGAGLGDLHHLVNLDAVVRDTEISLASITSKLDQSVKARSRIDAAVRENGEISSRSSRLSKRIELLKEQNAWSSSLLSSRREALTKRREALQKAFADAEAVSTELIKREEEVYRESSDRHELQPFIHRHRSHATQVLDSIFPIIPLDPQTLLYSILGVPLPIPDAKAPASGVIPHGTKIDEDSAATALGYTAMVVQQLSVILDKPLPYPVTCAGSRSLVRDPISIMTGPRSFPLYSKGVEKWRHDWAVFLLNTNIHLMLVDWQIKVEDLRHTLPNIKNLLLTIASGPPPSAPNLHSTPLSRSRTASSFSYPSTRTKVSANASPLQSEKFAGGSTRDGYTLGQAATNLSFTPGPGSSRR